MKPSDQSIKASIDLGQWMRSNRVIPHTHSDKACLHRLSGGQRVRAEAGERYRRDCYGDECRADGGLFDHRRRFAIGDWDTDYAGIIAAPYMHAHEMVDEAERIASSFALKYRIGDPHDDWYGVGTTSIVFWNPRIFRL